MNTSNIAFIADNNLKSVAIATTFAKVLMLQLSKLENLHKHLVPKNEMEQLQF
jgi:hypothetical protein